MGKPAILASQPTFSMHPVQYEDGTWGVSVMITGLKNEQQAEAAMGFMQKAFCGAEIEEH